MAKQVRVHIGTGRAIDLMNGDGTQEIRPARYVARVFLTRPDPGFKDATLITRCEIPAPGPAYPIHDMHHHPTKAEALACGEQLAHQQLLPALYASYRGSCEYVLSVVDLPDAIWVPEHHRDEIVAFRQEWLKTRALNLPEVSTT